MIWTVPNMLTMSRVAAAPGLALVFVVFARPAADIIAFVLFALAAVTDFFDGWLARRWAQESPLGRMLDPIADKAMVVIGLALLMAIYPLQAWLIVPAAVILLREVLISGLREFLGDVKLAVTGLAKWKTTVQMVAIGLLFLAEPVNVADALAYGESPRERMGAAVLAFAAGLLWLAATLTVITGWDYFAKGLPYIRSKEGR